MSGIERMSDEDAAYYAESMTGLQRQVVLLCSPRQSIGYQGLADAIGVKYGDVQQVGNYLQAANLAYVQPVRQGREYAGSAIFLNSRGERVRSAISRLGV